MLTDRLIKAAKKGTSVKRVWDNTDPSTKGFGLVIAPSGAKSFCLNFTSPESKKRKMLNLGKYPATSLAEARELARKARLLIDQGICPVEEQKRKKEALLAQQVKVSNQGTVRQLFDYYVQDMVLDNKKSAIYVEKAYNRDIDKQIGGLKTSDVTTEHCADIIQVVVDRGANVLANRTRSYLISAFNFGMSCQTDPRWRRKVPDFNLAHNPAIVTKKAIQREKPGDRFLTKEEIKQLWNQIGVDYMSADLALVIKLLLLTGQRVEEVLQASWSEFDLDEKLWVIPAARRKTRNTNHQPHIVLLTGFHVQLLGEVRLLSSNSPFLFPHQDGAQPRKADSLSQAIYRFCKKTKFDHFTARDLRRTWKTQAGSIGIDLELRNRIQGHALQDIGSRNYDRYDYLEEKRQAMVEWSEWIKSL